MFLRIILSIFLILNLAGCATAQKKGELNSQMQQYETRITKLEDELKQKDENIYRLEKELTNARNVQLKKAQAAQEPAKKPAQKKQEASIAMTPVKIQTALKNAGLYQGPIDGKIGKNTNKAIIEFQRLNGLKPDGIIGKRTWAALQEFLD